MASIVTYFLPHKKSRIQEDIFEESLENCSDWW